MLTLSPSSTWRQSNRARKAAAETRYPDRKPKPWYNQIRRKYSFLATSVTATKAPRKGPGNFNDIKQTQVIGFFVPWLFMWVVYLHEGVIWESQCL